jgi:hypothetical protein
MAACAFPIHCGAVSLIFLLVRLMPTQKQMQSQKLIALSKEVGLPVRELMLSDAHLEQVAPIFYEGLPKLARMTMNRDKFKAFFVKQRLQIADELFPVKA